MLQRIRDSITGWMAYVVVAILVVPFAFWGIGDYLGFFDEEYAAKVNDAEISLAEYRNVYANRYAQIRDLYGASFRAELIDEAMLRQEVLEQMVDEELMYQYAVERGFRVSDAQVAGNIHARSEFQEDGRFSPERYRYLLQLSGQSPAVFERRLRRGLLIAQLQRAVAGSASIPHPTLESLVRVADQRREFAWVELPVGRFTATVEVTDAEVEAYYESNRTRYMTPETVDVSWLELSRGSIAAGIETDEDTLRAFYQEYRRELTAGEQRLVRHILVTPDGRTLDEARERAAGILARIADGEAFEDLAREISDDLDSAMEGGMLGWIERGVFMPELEGVLFGLERGQVSDPVQTGFGWHVLRVDDIDTVPVPTFEELQETLVDEYRQREAEKQFYDMAERMADRAYEKPDSLEPAADAVGLDIQSARGIHRNSEDGIAAYAAVRRAIFSSQVLEDGYNSQVIELEGNRVVVVRVDARRVPVQIPLEAVRERIRESLAVTEARRLTAEAGERIIERARAGEALEDVARELGGEWHAPRLVGRSDTQAPGILLASVFRTPRPVDGPVLRGLRIGANDYAVYQLTGVVPGQPEGMEAEDFANLSRGLSARLGNAEFEALIATLRADAKISYGRSLWDDPVF